MKKNKNIIIIALIIIIITMSIAYSKFATKLEINGTSKIIGTWDIRITGVDISERTLGCDPGIPEYTDTTATFHAKLTKPGDLIIYEIIIENKGTIDGTLKDITFTSDEENTSDAIKYVTDEPDKILPAGEETTIMVAIIYNTEITQEPITRTSTITAKIEYIQK